MSRTSQTDVRLDGTRDLRPDREAITRPGGPRARGERLMVPKADFRSYYGRPVLQPTPWSDHDIAGYLFLGGLAGASSTLAAAADLMGRPHLARAAKAGAACALGGSLYCLIHDLGRPARFLNMLRVFKVTSPMSMGTWILSAYGPPAGLAALTAVTCRFPRAGRAATVTAGLIGPAVATYTAALISDTAVPVWHDAYREMPFVFAGSAAASAGGLGILAAPVTEAGPARSLALIGALTEYTAVRRMERRLGMVARPLKKGRGGVLMRLGKALTLTGAVAAQTVARRDRTAAVAAGAALLAGALCTRFGIFHAGLQSSRDPRYTVQPQRARLEKAEGEGSRS
ncbi:NrfD/PsrC family molybdoenzyme membrane anchor subunit [Sinosporangium siamense]|uniref:Polysulfide reductase n=1 Tax=Sinosporangium siamense TaxID=1367973 RepID=A0A919RKI3_9ACTN|nr:NrfD/PsrC family molybdoenzyme membrane anchor subunit [Sinosporangium siamense]GII94520.1 polysulfide reductase [Sinosporangium siamense]